MEVTAEVRWAYMIHRAGWGVSAGVVELAGGMKGPSLSSLGGCDDWEVFVVTAGRLMLCPFSIKQGRGPEELLPS